MIKHTHTSLYSQSNTTVFNKNNDFLCSLFNAIAITAIGYQVNTFIADQNFNSTSAYLYKSTDCYIQRAASWVDNENARSIQDNCFLFQTYNVSSGSTFL